MRESGSDANIGTARDAAKKLRKFLDPEKKCGNRLLLLMAFDEAHSLMATVASGNSETRYTMLRRALRDIQEEPFFAVFMSTPGSFHHDFSPYQALDPSARIQSSDWGVPSPYTAVGFDQFAIHVSVKNGHKLSQLASINHIAHLGRPL